MKHEPERLDQGQYAWIRDVTDQDNRTTLSLARRVDSPCQQTRAQPLPAPVGMNVQLQNAQHAPFPGLGTGCSLPGYIAIDPAICGAHADIASADPRQ